MGLDGPVFRDREKVNMTFLIEFNLVGDFDQNLPVPRLLTARITKK